MLLFIKENLLGPAVEPGGAAHGPEALQQSGGQLVAGLFRDPGPVVDIQAHHVYILHEGQMVRVHAQIAPVGVHDVLGLIGHFQGFQDPVHRIGGGAQEVGVLLLHQLGIRVSAGGGHVLAGGQGLGAQVKELLHGLTAARHILLHFIDEIFPAAGQGGVDGAAVPGGGDHAEVVRHHVPVDVQPELVHDGLAASAGVFRAAELAQLVQRCFKFKAAPPEAGGHAAREIVLLDEQRFFTGLGQPARGCQSAVARSDHNGIKFRHKLFLLSSLFCYVALPQYSMLEF